MKKFIAIAVIVLIISGSLIFQKIQSPTALSKYKDGVYTGTIGSASQYGDVQVKVTISEGKISAIDIIKKPDQGGGHTLEVNNMSFPILKEETIKAQSSKIDNVTGATQTTEGFIQSLQSALDQAKV